jgi:hypothetical protein
VNSSWSREPRLIWSFWTAAAVVAVGGAIPFLIGGSSSRIASVFIPFAIAALAFVTCALVHDMGRAITSALYLLAGLAIVYGLLTMFALPLQLAVLGTCPVPPQPCPTGVQHALTVAENTGIGFAGVFGIAALFIGFFGLVVVYRRSGAAAKPPAPPVRSIPPVMPRPAKPAPVETPKAENGAGPAETKAEMKELPEPEPELELPAHEEEDRPELPPHESSSSNT